MSISIVLVPLAIAAVSAWQASRPEADAEGRTICHVTTRMRDEKLLAAALADTQAQVTTSGESLIAEWQGVQGEFRRDEQGIWQANFSGDIDADGASAVVVAIDKAYGHQVQQAVLVRLRERAPASGMSIASETVDDDETVTLVLDVSTGA